MKGFETLAVLTRSRVRLHILRYLIEEGSATASDLSHHIEASQRTAARTLKVLEEEGLATSNGRTYHATTYAELLAPEVFGLLETVDSNRERAAFLEAFPRDAIDVDLETVDGIVTRRHTAQPHGPISEAVDTLTDAMTIRVLAPIASPLYVRPFVTRVRKGADIEAVVNVEAYDEFCIKLRAGIRLAATFTDVSLAVHETVDFGLLQCDECVVLGAYNNGILQATFETDDEDAMKAAQKTYQRHRDAATQVIG